MQTDKYCLFEQIWAEGGYQVLAQVLLRKRFGTFSSIRMIEDSEMFKFCTIESLARS